MKGGGWACVGSVVVLIVLGPCFAGADGCAGDCDGSGTVDIADLLNPSCPAADLDRDGLVSLDEKRLAVDQGLRGCAPSPAEQAAIVDTLIRPLARLPLVELLFSLAISGAGNSGPCDLGGRYQSRCEPLSDERIRIYVDADDCAAKTIEGPGLIQGSEVLFADGLCPNLLVAGTVTLELALTTRLFDQAGGTILSTSVDGRSHIDGFLFDRPPCRIRGGSGSFRGTIRYAGSAGADAFLFSGASLAFQLAQFQLNPICDPGVITAFVDGSLSVQRDGGRPLLLSARGLRVSRNRTSKTVTFEGTVVIDVLGGEVYLHSVQPLVDDLSADAPIAGVLELRANGRSDLLEFE